MPPNPDRHIGKTLGYNKYHLKEKLGGGTYGTVYRATRRASQQDNKDTPQDFAVKILKPQSSPEDKDFPIALAVEVFNFSQEAQRITALSPHENIVPLIELAFDPQEAVFYFVMPVAQEGSLKKHIRRGVPLPPSVLIPFIEKAANGLDHAHRKKIVHRDIKPDNLLLPGNDGLWVSDFGIAVESHSFQSLPPVKQKGGTVPYMAPEQFEGKPTKLSDIYGLAVVTYEGLTGRWPFEGNAWQIEYGHRQVPPPPFSEKGISVDDRLRALEAEVVKALAKDPEQRPSSTTLFAQTLKDIVQEKPHGKVFEAVKPQLLAGVNKQPDMKEPPQPEPPVKPEQPVRDMPMAQKQEQPQQPIQPQQPLEPKELEKLVKNFKRWEEHLLYYWASDECDVQDIDNPDLELPIPYRLAQIQNDKNALEQFVNNNLIALQTHTARLLSEPTVSKHAFFIAQFGYAVRAGQRILGIPSDQILPWSIPMQQLLARVSHPDLQRLVKEDMALTPAPVSLESSVIEAVKLQEKPGTCLLVYRGHGDGYNSGAWSPDGTRFALGGVSGIVQVRDARTNDLLWANDEFVSLLRTLAWSPDGSRIATLGWGNEVRIWEASSGRTLLTYTGSPDWGRVEALAWSPDGSRLASASSSSEVQIWEASSGQVLFTYTGHKHWIQALAWSPDGSKIASAGRGGVQIWDVSSGQLLLTYSDNKGHPEMAAWSPDGSRLASICKPTTDLREAENYTVQIWDASSGQLLHAHQEYVEKLAWSPDGSKIASSNHNEVRIWDANSGQVLLTRTEWPLGTSTLAWSPDGSKIASSDHGKVQIWDTSSGQALFTYSGHDSGAWRLAWSPDGSRIASSGYGYGDKEVQIWEASSGQLLFTCPTQVSYGIKPLAWSPDGSKIAVCGYGVQIWEASSGQAVLTYSRHKGSVEALAWSPDGSKIASNGWDKGVQIWEASSGQALLTYTGHKDRIRALAWSPDGSKIASADDPGLGKSVQIWEASSGQALLTRTELLTGITALAWSPDGSRLAVAYCETVQIWQVV